MTTTPTLTKHGLPLKRDTVRAYKERHGIQTTFNQNGSTWTARTDNVSAEGMSEVQAIGRLASLMGTECEL